MQSEFNDRTIRLGRGGKASRFWMLRPCVIASRETLTAVTGRLKLILERQAIPVAFKAFFDRANRTAITTAQLLWVKDDGRRLAGIYVKDLLRAKAL